LVSSPCWRRSRDGRGRRPGAQLRRAGSRGRGARRGARAGPVHQLLFSADAFGLPGLYYLGAHVFRQALGRLPGERVRSGEWAAGDAGRIARMVCAGNARRVYRLGDAAP